MSDRRQITACVLAKCEARKRVFNRLYAEFDYLDAPCREALREQPYWEEHVLRKCSARECSHVAH